VSEGTGGSTVITPVACTGTPLRPTGASPRSGERRTRYGTAWLLPTVGVTVGLAGLYGPALRDLVALWTSVPYYSYGVLVPLWSVWLAASERSRVGAIRARRQAGPFRRDLTGLIVVMVGLAGLAFASAHGSLTVAVLSLPVVLTGLGRFALGREAFRPLAFPVGFLALMTPLPPSVIPALSLHLQHLAAWVTESVLTTLAIPFARDGVFIHLRPVTVHVSEACNGLRFLLAMAVLGVAFGWTTRRGPACRLVVLTVALGAAIASNLIRVAGTTILVHFWGAGASLGLFHHVFGKSIYLATLGAVFLLVVRLRTRE
jgi:exosortase